MPRPLASFPEELLLRILALALDTPTSNRFPRHRAAPLLVSHQFLRIASPLLYHTLHLHSSHQATRAVDTLTRHPTLASAVRRVIFAGIWHVSADLLSLCNRVYDVDICLDGGPCHPASEPRGLNDLDAEAFCFALEERQAIKHLTIRKDPAVYVTHPRPIYILQRLAQAVRQWSNLETVHFALRISASSTTLPLARALSVAPRLHTVRAQLPAIWNNLLLVASTNPRLEKVMLYTEPMLGPIQHGPNASMGLTVIKGGRICDDIEHAVLGTGLYMMEAKKHTRLSELIKRGTSIIRTRAHTTTAILSTPSPGGTPLGGIRAKEVAAEWMADMNRGGFGLVVAQPLATISGRYVHAHDVW